MAKNTDMESLLARHEQVLESIAKKEGEPSLSKPYPPASESAIAAAEKRLDFKFPPGYREFLKLHNGWEGFNAGDIAVLGVDGPGYSKPAAQFKDDVRMFDKSFQREGKGKIDELRRQEKQDPDVLYVPDHPPAATNFNGDWWVFDRNRPGKGGEYPLARVANGEFVECRWSSFRDWVEEVARQKQGQLEELGEGEAPAREGAEAPARPARRSGTMKSKAPSKRSAATRRAGSAGKGKAKRKTARR